MKSKFFLMLLFVFITLNTPAQNFPFEIKPLSSPFMVSIQKPIKHVSSDPFSSTETYSFSTPVNIQGITFSLVLLDFKNGKLTKMIFPIKRLEDCQPIINSLSGKYKKAVGSNYDTPYAYRNGNILIYLIKTDGPDMAKNNGYLYYEYQAASEF